MRVIRCWEPLSSECYDYRRHVLFSWYARSCGAPRQFTITLPFLHTGDPVLTSGRVKGGEAIT